MSTHAINWSEGMFLRPHHFQAGERRLREEIATAEQWNVGYSYGLRKLVVDEDALTNYRIVVNECQIRLHDGSHLRYPEDANLDALTVPREAFDRQSRVVVLLGLPKLQLGKRNVGPRDADCRFTTTTEEVEDENRTDGPQMVDVRWPQLKLFLSGQEQPGYETLPILRLRRGEMAEAPPQIDKEYIPPILACDAWPVLQQEILGALCDQIGSKIEILATQMNDRGVAFESGHREDTERIFKLNALNSAYGYLRNLPAGLGVHPFVAFSELTRLAGQLAIFRPERKLPDDLPQYDHDDLGTCFYKVKRWIELGLETGEIREYKRREFTGAGKQMEVRMEREWLDDRSWTFFIGVHSKLNYEQCTQLLRGEGGMDMKVASSAEAEDCFLRGRQGVSLAPQPDPPRLFPGKDWVYWKVDRQSHAWKGVQDTLALAIRLNDRQFVGKIDGQVEFQVRARDGKEINMKFVLFAIPNEYL